MCLLRPLLGLIRRLAEKSEGKHDNRTVAEQIALQDPLALTEVTSFIGASRFLSDRVSALYELLLSLVVNCPDVSKVLDVNQTTATLHCLQSLRYEFLMSVITLWRGHVIDSTNYSRKSIEIAAFLLEIWSDVES